jgi:hypothetical protein
MEVLKIAGGLAVIAVIVVVVGMGREERGSGASPERHADRSFTSGSSSARFVSVPRD